MENTQGNTKEELGRCPECGNPVYEGKKSYYCSGYKEGCKFQIWKNSLDRLGHEDISPDQARQLLNGDTIAFTGLKSKAGKEFDAGGKLDKDETYGWHIGLIFGDSKPEKQQPSGREENE